MSDSKSTQIDSQIDSSLALKLQDLVPSLFAASQVAGNAYLRFELTPELSVAFAMEDIQESLLVPAENMTLIPNMPPSVMGLMSSRDRVFCIVDLAQLVEFSPLSSYLRQHHVIVLRVNPASLGIASEQNELLLGIAVNKILGITRTSSDGIQSPMIDFYPNLTPFVQGCVLAKEQELLVLDTAAVVRKVLS